MPKRSLESISRPEIENAIAESEALAQIKRHRPSVEDYVAEGVLPEMPEIKPDGTVDCKIEGHGNVVRALQMNEEANRMEAWHMDNRAEGPWRAIQREERAERKARKFHRPRATIVVPEMPWKRNRESDS